MQRKKSQNSLIKKYTILQDLTEILKNKDNERFE